MTSIGNVLDRNRGIGPGFDLLRIGLAMAILFTHSHDIVTGLYSEYAGGPWQLPVRMLVPIFFALSGFLITGSAMRLRLRDFILNRGMRIVPALLVDIIVAACLIGPFFTTLPLDQYFSSRGFFMYFTNVTGVINYTLPGVFADNVNPNTVNGSLWTVPFEIGCYIVMSIVIISGLLKHRTTLLIVSILAIFSVGVAALALRHMGIGMAAGSDADHVSIIGNFTTAKRGYVLYLYFLAGMFAYLFQDRIPFSKALAAISVLIVVCLSVFSAQLPNVILTKVLICLPFLTYLTVFVGMLSIPKIPLYHRGDYSYGVYLYGFPLQQSLIALFPERFNVLGHFVCSAVIATLFAIFSWHCIEKPILKYRKKFSFTARKTDPTEQRLPEPEMGSALQEEGRSTVVGADPVPKPA